MTWHWTRLAIPIKSSTIIDCQTLISLPTILCKAADVMARSFPSWIVKSLSINKRLIQIQVLKWIQLRNVCSRCRYERGAIRCRNCKRNWISFTRLELVLTGKPKIVAEVVGCWTIGKTKLQTMLAFQVREVVF